MTAKRKKASINGWMAIDKPYNMGSTDVVRALKRILNPVKIGHAGTLDPLATGVLPIAFGEATKTIRLGQDATKTYICDITFGTATTTDDLEGDIIETSENLPTAEEIEAALPQFLGAIQQTPPAYSAIKVNGKRAYDLARDGKEVELKSREVVVHSIKILYYQAPICQLEVICGKGTYIRSLGRDIAKTLGSCGHITMLRRIKVGSFEQKDTILLEKLEEIVHKEGPFNQEIEGLLPVEAVLDDIPVLSITPQSATDLHHGKRISCGFDAETVCALLEGKLVAIGSACKGEFTSARVFNHYKKGDNDVDYS